MVEQGENVELTEDFGPIPSGIYRFEGKRGKTIYLSLGGKVQLSLDETASRFIKDSSRSTLCSPGLPNFLLRYARKLETEPQATRSLGSCRLSPILSETLLLYREGMRERLNLSPPDGCVTDGGRKRENRQRKLCDLESSQTIRAATA